MEMLDKGRVPYQPSYGINKKGQLKIQQMAFMLVALFLLLVLAGLFFMSLYSGQLKAQAEQIKKNKAVNIAALIGQSAEFSCGSNCIDADRLVALSEKDIYGELWNIESIRIYSVFPKEQGVFTILDKQEDKETRTVESYISLCKRNEKGFSCKIGRIVIGY